MLAAVDLIQVTTATTTVALTIITAIYVAMTARIAKETAASAKASRDAARIAILSQVFSSQPYPSALVGDVVWDTEGAIARLDLVIQNVGAGVMANVTMAVEGDAYELTDTVARSLDVGGEGRWTIRARPRTRHATPGGQGPIRMLVAFRDVFGIESTVSFSLVIGEDGSVGVEEGGREYTNLPLLQSELEGLASSLLVD